MDQTDTKDQQPDEPGEQDSLLRYRMHDVVCFGQGFIRPQDLGPAQMDRRPYSPRRWGSPDC